MIKIYLKKNLIVNRNIYNIWNIYKDKYIKTKIKIYDNKTYTNSQYNKIRKMINSVLVYLQNYEILFLLIQMKSIIHKYV